MRKVYLLRSWWFHLKIDNSFRILTVRSEFHTNDRFCVIIRTAELSSSFWAKLQSNWLNLRTVIIVITWSTERSNRDRLLRFFMRNEEKNEAEIKRNQAMEFSEICGIHLALQAAKAVHFCWHRLWSFLEKPLKIWHYPILINSLLTLQWERVIW